MENEANLLLLLGIQKPKRVSALGVFGP